MRRLLGMLRDDLKRSGATIRWHDPAATYAEGIASRGDRRIGRVIERVWRAVSDAKVFRRLWEQAIKFWPPYTDYQKKTDREIPLVLLDPVT